MPVLTSASVLRAATDDPVPESAIAEIAAALHPDGGAGVLLFCADSYDPDRLAAAATRHFGAPVAGCTTAGEIGAHYGSDGITALSFAPGSFRMHVADLGELKAFTAGAAAGVAADLTRAVADGAPLDPERVFGIAFLDGLSLAEEAAIASLASALPSLPLIGGSAGDSLRFRETRILAHGRFRPGTGALVLVESALPFRTFQLQNFVPSDTDLVITAADPATRTVHEIDGGPAAAEYAALLGLRESELGPQVYSRFPVMLQIGDDWYVRSIQRANPDGSLTFYCAIDEGLVLTVAESRDMIASLEAKVAELRSHFSRIACTIGCDCILRRLQLLETGQTARAEAALAGLEFVGFSTFGEQYGPVHMNQTLTGVVIGER